MIKIGIMKKFLFSIFAIAALTCTLVACGSDDNDKSYNQTGSPATASAATYSGTWTRSTSDGTPETATGTITLVAGDNDYTTSMSFVCSQFDLNSTSIANITWANDGFVFNQDVIDNNPSNGLGAKFSGHITNGIITTKFSLTKKVGRKTTTYYFSFEGAKQ